MDNAAIESEVQAKGLIAPRVTPQMIEEAIDPKIPAQYHVFPNTTVTVCCLSLRNGFTVVGESACASPENFNEELGRQIAFDNAKHQIWKLEGYALRNMLMEVTQ